jgi:hypothetical protein
MCGGRRGRRHARAAHGQGFTFRLDDSPAVEGGVDVDRCCWRPETMSWQAILEGGLKDRARKSADTILEALSALERDHDWSPSLAGGTAGLAILHGYLAQTGGREDHAVAAVRCLQRAIAAAADHPESASLYGGLTGVGWALAHLQGRVPGFDGEDELAEIDQLLLDHLAQTPWPDTYDLIDGLVGFGVYALERGEAPPAACAPVRPRTGRQAARGTRAGAVACLGRVIDRLAEMAEQLSDGITWASREEWLPLEYRNRYPARYYNLGLAHGVPGVVALLGHACAAGVGSAKARPLLDGTVRWLLAQQTPQGFRSGIGVDNLNRPARLAWCYGDPGVAAALLWASRCVGEPAGPRGARPNNQEWSMPECATGRPVWGICSTACSRPRARRALPTQRGSGSSGRSRCSALGEALADTKPGSRTRRKTGPGWPIRAC